MIDLAAAARKQQANWISQVYSCIALTRVLGKLGIYDRSITIYEWIEYIDNQK